MILPREQSQAATPKEVHPPVVAEKMPPAGPHDRPELTNYDACPGAGALPPQQDDGAESDPGAG